jgi:uncharacterized protein YcbK (DUF882 family)
MGDLTKDFSTSEFMCKCGCRKCTIDLKLVHILQSIRDVVGFPLAVSSGYRCEEHNRAVGGEPNSAHTRGLAVDLLIPASPLRYKFLKEALVVFKRIGISEEFIHVDVDKNLPQGVLWIYGRKE